MNRLIIFILLLFLLASCSKDDKRAKNYNTSNFNQIPKFDLKEELKITEFNDDEFFGYVSNVLSGSNESILVSDPTTRKIHIFNNIGTYTGFLGGYGAGPGEFRRISNMDLLTSDTLQVIDITLARITFFTQSADEWVKSSSFNIPIGSNINSDLEMFSFRQFHRTDAGYIATFESGISSYKADNFIKECYQAFDKNFNPVKDNSPKCHNKLELIMHENSNASEQTVSAMPIPEGYKTLTTVTQDGKIVRIWTEQPVVTIQNFYEDKNLPFEFEFHSAKIPITDDLKTELTQKAIPNSENSNIKQEQVFKSIPTYKGFSEQILVDDNNQIWILGRNENDRLIWLIYRLDGQLIGLTDHPGGVFTQIKNTRVYVANNTGDEEPSFAIYRLETQN